MHKQTYKWKNLDMEEKPTRPSLVKSSTNKINGYTTSYLGNSKD